MDPRSPGPWRPTAIALALASVTLLPFAVVLELDTGAGLAGQTAFGISLALAGTALVLAFFGRSRIQTDPRRRLADVLLACGGGVLFAGTGVAFVVRAAHEQMTSIAQESLLLLASLPFVVVAMAMLPRPVTENRSDRWNVASSTAVAALAVIAILAQVSGDEWGATDGRVEFLVEMTAISIAFTLLFFVAARGRHPGMAPFRQLALWLSSALIVLVAGVVDDGSESAPGLLAATMGAYVVAALLGAAAALRPPDELETPGDVRARELMATVVPMLPAGIGLIILTVCSFRGIATRPLTGLCAGIAAFIVLGDIVRIRAAAAQELRRARDERGRAELRSGTELPWVKSLLGQAQDIVSVVDVGGTVIYQTPAVAGVLGYEPDSWIGRSYTDLVDDGQHESLAVALAASLTRPGHPRTIPLRLKASDGSVRETETSVMALSGDDMPVSAFVLTSRDVTERHRLHELLETRSQVDQITGRLNLLALRMHAEESLRTSQRGQVALIKLDVDGFTEFNDAHGHDVGDAVLASVAETLALSVRPWDVIGRVGGDEFAVVVVARNVEQAVGRIHDRLAHGLRGVTLPDGSEVMLTASAGYAINDRGDETADEMLRYADLALARVRSSRRMGLLRFVPEMRESLAERVRETTLLRAAFDNGEFRLHFQPIIDLSTGRITGVESLVRWLHPTRGLLPAAGFVPLIEELGLHSELCETVVLQAASALAEIRARCPGSGGIAVGVNVTAQDLDDALPVLVERALRTSGAPADRFVVEVTESIVARAADALPVMTALRATGVQIALDDFGVGYSSLSFLANFPVDFLKVDRSFVLDLGNDVHRDGLARAVIGVGRALSLPTIVEGVETVEQLAAVRAAGAEMAQGYLFGRPVPLEEMMRLIVAEPQSSLMPGAVPEPVPIASRDSA